MLQLYKNIRERRLALGLTQTDLALKTGYKDKSMIAKIEAGKVDLSQSKIAAFAAALQTTSSDLLGNTVERGFIMKNRIRELRNAHELTMKELGNFLGVAESTISQYETGKREPNLATLEAIADFFNVDMDYLLGKSNCRNRCLASIGFSADNILPLPEMRSIPLLGTIACGEPILAQENLEGEVFIPSHVTADFALRCKGDSMINARIFDGDIVYIRQQDTVEDGQIAAVLIDEEATLKRVHFFPDRIVLEAANPLYPPIVRWGEDMLQVRIIGKAVAFTSTIL